MAFPWSYLEIHVFSVFEALRGSTGTDQKKWFLLRFYIKNVGFCSQNLTKGFERKPYKT